MQNDKSLLLNVKHVDDDITTYLNGLGEVFRVFDQQDSGCISYGFNAFGKKWFVKYSDRAESIHNMKNAMAFNMNVVHKHLPRFLNSFRAGEGFVLVYEWVEGEILSSPISEGVPNKDHPDSSHYRFRHLPLRQIIDALSVVYELHVFLEEKGYIAVDFYDGCMIYDFAKDDIHLCDFDHYVKGPYILDLDRQLGSSRFMAPEEFVKGSIIDQRTNVFTMGATAFVFLADNKRQREHWRASEALFQAANKAISRDRDERYSSIHEFYEHWMRALK